MKWKIPFTNDIQCSPNHKNDTMIMKLNVKWTVHLQICRLCAKLKLQTVSYFNLNYVLVFQMTMKKGNFHFIKLDQIFLSF